MSPIQQMLLGVGAVAKKTFVDDVFHVQVHAGSSATRSINNGIDLAGKGGLIWAKTRNQSYAHTLFDTVRGSTKYIRSNGDHSEFTYTGNGITSFNNNGYTLGNDSSWQGLNHSGNNYVLNTFRRAPGFFDVVTYTGNGSARTISHSLGSVPGMILVKKTSASDPWSVYHRSLDSTSPENYRIFLNESDERVAANTSIWNQTKPTATNFSLGTSDQLNGNGATYVAYLFAGGASTAATARSVEFDGSEDSLVIESNSDLAFGTGDFTIEFWVKPQAVGYAILFDMRPNPAASNGLYPTIYVETDGTLKYYANSGAQITGTNTLYQDQWQHIAVSRSGTSTKMFLNGIQEGSTYSDSHDYLNGDTTIGLRSDGSTGDFDGYISNVRCVKGTAVYTSSFRPPTEPLTNITNTVLLCCNNSSTTGSTVTPSTITATGTTASTDSPFDDPAGFVFGDSGTENVIKNGSFKVDSGNADVYVGFEPQWVLVKNITTSGAWFIFDAMRGIVSDGIDPYLRPDSSNAEGSTTNFIDVTPTGFKISNLGGTQTFIFTAIRRPDGYVGKPPELGTDVFAMPLGLTDGTKPAFNTGFPVDLLIYKKPAVSGDWFTGARLMGGKFLKTNDTDGDGSNTNIQWDFQDGMGGWSGLSSGYQSWSWKRHAGFDVVAYGPGNEVEGRQIQHSLNKIPEMIWIKNRDSTDHWIVYHKGLNGGTNPEQYYLWLDTTNAEDSTQVYWNNTAPTSTHFTVGNGNAVNQNNKNYIAMLFASVDGISKVGYYSGTGNSNPQTVGFLPRIVLVKRADGTGDWNLIWGFNTGVYASSDLRLRLNKTNARSNDDNWMDVTSTTFNPGVSGSLGNSIINSNGAKYIYWAHA